MRLSLAIFISGEVFVVDYDDDVVVDDDDDDYDDVLVEDGVGVDYAQIRW